MHMRYFLLHQRIVISKTVMEKNDRKAQYGYDRKQAEGCSVDGVANVVHLFIKFRLLIMVVGFGALDFYFL